VKLTAHLDTVPRIRMRGAIPSLPLVPLPICTSFATYSIQMRKHRFIKGIRPKREGINVAGNEILFGTSVVSPFKTHSIDLFALNTKWGALRARLPSLCCLSPS